MNPFRRADVRYGRTLPPETPTSGPPRPWDDRIGSARVQARSWRLIALGELAVVAGLASGLVWQSARGTVTPWVVQVDRLGQAQVVAPATAGYQPTDAQIAWHLARLHRRGAGRPRRPHRGSANLAARLRLHHRQGRPGAERLRPGQRPLRQRRQDRDLRRGLQRHPRLAVELPRRLDRDALRERRPERFGALDRHPHHRGCSRRTTPRR